MLAALSLASGFSALVYEVLWAKDLGLVLGGTSLAQMVVLASFLGGLAAGNAALGRRADAVAPLKLYGALELGIAALAVAASLMFRAARWAFEWRYVFAVAGVLLPAFLMGGTIPALSRAARPQPGEGVERAVARLYFWNCLGAAAGALAAGYILLARLGLDGTTAVAVCVNALCGLAALKASLPEAPKPIFKEKKAHPEVLLPAVVVLEAAFLAGLASLVLETGWVRLLALVMGSSSYSFSAMLAGFIGGIALGSLLLAKTRLGRAEPARLFGWAQLGVAAAVLACIPFYERLPYVFHMINARVPRSGFGFAEFEAAKLVFCFLLMGPATTLIGMTLPLMSRLGVEGDEVGRGVGTVFAANTAGNVLGAACAYFLLPGMGLEPMMRAATTLCAVVGLAVLALSLSWSARRRWALAAAVLASLAIYRRVVPYRDRTMLSLGDYRGGAKFGFTFEQYRASALREMSLSFVEDDPESTVTVLHGRDKLGNVIVLKINGKTEASNTGDMTTQVLCADLPLLLRPQTRDVLVVGLGSGVSAGAALKHPSVRSVDIVELSRGVVRAADRFFRRDNAGVLEDPRARLTIADAKTFLHRPGRSYDLVVSEPSNPWMAGVANLFTADFYADVRRRLRPGGVMMQWFHLYEMDDETFRLVLRTFASAFPRVSVWNVHDADVLLVGGDEDLKPDWDLADRTVLQPGVFADLDAAGIHTIAGLLSMQTASDASARRMAGEGPLNTDRRPLLEYWAPKAYFMGSFSELIDREDDRIDPERRKGLLLASYRARRPLKDLEFMDMVTVKHSKTERAVVKYIIDEWIKQYPRDPRAAIAELIFFRETGNMADARVALKRLKRLDPSRPDLKEFEKTLAGGVRP